MTAVRTLGAALVAAASLHLALIAPALAAGGDHALISRYPDSRLTKRDVEDFARYQLVVGLDAKSMRFEGRGVEGTLTRIVYTNPDGRSTLEIFRNYRDALERAGAEVQYTCEMDACGPAFARSAWGRFNGLFAASDGDPRYLAARVARAGAEAYVAVMVGRRRTQLDVVEVKAMQAGLVAVDAASLARGIEGQGSARVYGILFDVDKAEIRPESKPALDAIAELLRGRPELSLFVVGHTDGTGALDHNLRLSQARARAVAEALSRQYGIALARLDAHGAGPLAPVAPNTTEDGRRSNRRVELVAR
jgi:OmpA-OmpF porin, OOP family